MSIVQLTENSLLVLPRYKRGGEKKLRMDMEELLQ